MALSTEISGYVWLRNPCDPHWFATFPTDKQTKGPTQGLKISIGFTQEDLQLLFLYVVEIHFFVP